MASVGSEDGDVGFQIAPMVDVVFVLMLFFMASAGSQVVERELSVNLPGGASESKGPGKVQKTPIIVDISADGQVVVNSKNYGTPTDHTLTPLREFFRDTIEKFGAEDPVILRPNIDTTHERVIDVLNALGASGVKNLTFG